MDKNTYVKSTIIIIMIIAVVFFMFQFEVLNNLIKLKWDTESSQFLRRTNTSWVFLGDSTMNRLFDSIIKTKRSCKSVKRAPGRCNLLPYLGQKKRKKWTKPSKNEGPHMYGLNHPFCTDCHECNSELYDCGKHTFEYISVEFARDVEIQTPTSNTTQETIAQYLQLKECDIFCKCVVNSGIHDMALPHLTDQLYVKHVHFYVQQLVNSCQNVVWMSMTAVRGDKGFPQNNGRIHRWNMLIKGMLHKNFPKVGFIDVFSMSNFTNLHFDNVHLKRSGYDLIASFFN